MPFDKRKYPANWDDIRARILERDGHKCKVCGVPNYAIGARDRHGEWHNERDIHCLNSDVGYSLFGDFPEMIKIVLTVAHYPDPDPMNCSDDNLQALCQLHHNQLDAPMRARNAANTRRRKALERSGQQELPL